MTKTVWLTLAGIIIALAGSGAFVLAANIYNGGPQ
jgi:hypothetical protein